MKKKILAAVLAASFISLVPLPAQAVEYPAYGAVCSVGGKTSFTATKRGYYYYVWRTGSSSNGSAMKYLTAGQPWEISTPGAATSSTRFGVLTLSTTFAYVTCS